MWVAGQWDNILLLLVLKLRNEENQRSEKKIKNQKMMKKNDACDIFLS